MQQTLNYRSFKIGDMDILRHKPGYSAYNVDTKLAILHIPKNASSAIKSSTSVYTNWLPRTNIRKHDVKRVCVVLRDPIDRFLSTINMYIGGRPILSNFVDIKNNSNKFVLNSTNDAHFLQQSCFLLDLDRDMIDFFYFNDKVIEDINHYYGMSLDTSKVYTSNRIITHADENIIRQVYEKDYTLIESVNFVNLKKEK